MLGEKIISPPKNSVQIQRQHQRQVPPEERASELTTPLVPVSTASPTPATTRVPKDVDETLPELGANYISDNEDDNFDDTIRPAKGAHTIRRSKRVLEQLRANTKDGLHHIAALAANEQAEVPDLSIKNKKLAKGWASANLDLQMKEWAFKEYFAAAVVDDKTGEKLE